MTYCWVLTGLVLNMYFVGIATYFIRLSSGRVIAPEDVKHMWPDFTVTPTLERWYSIARNDVENILPFVVTVYCWQYVVLPLNSSSSAPLFLGGTVMTLIFGSFRVLYTMTYACGLQPWRSICYFIAQLTSMVMLVWSNVLAIQLATIPIQTRVIMLTWLVFIIMTYSIALFTSVVRAKTATPVSPEDAKFYGNSTLALPSRPQITSSPIASKIQSNPTSPLPRFINCHRNTLEFLMLFALGQLFVFKYVIILNNTPVMWVIASLLIFVVVLRIIYTICCFTKSPGIRTFTWGCSLFVLMVVLSWSGIAVLITDGKSL